MTWRLGAAAALLFAALTLGMVAGGRGETAPGPAGGVVMSKSFYNTASLPTPAGRDGSFPVHTFAASAPGAVPAGSIMVPYVDGRPVRYQADECARPWHFATGKGVSQTGCQFSMFLPAIAAQGVEQVVWKVEPGGYDHRSNCDVSCVTAHSNLNLKLTQVNRTYWLTSDATEMEGFGVYIDPATGAVTRAILRASPAFGLSCGNAPCRHYTIHGPGCSTGRDTPTVLSSDLDTPGTAKITNPGSGCEMQGSGAATASVNRALVNGPFTAANHCGIVRRYLEGPVADGWEVACAFADDRSGQQWGFPFPIMRAWVEAWKNADGSVYAIRATAMVSEDQYVPKGAWQSYTYDVQWYDGAAPGASTCIRCVNDTGYPIAGVTTYLPLQRVEQTDDGAAMVFGPSAQMDWVAVDAGGSIGRSAALGAGLNAVVPTMNPADKARFKAAQVIEPIDDAIRLSEPIVTRHPNNVAHYQSIDDLPVFNSNTLDGLDCVSGWGTAGNHCWFAPVPSKGVDHYWATTQAADHGASWLQSYRVATAAQFSCQAGVYENDTRQPVNFLPASLFTPPAAMTAPVRANPTIFTVNGNIYDMANNAPICQTFEAASRVGGNPSQWDHYTVYARYLYLIEGEEWELAAIDAATSNMLMTRFTPGGFSTRFGGRTYYTMSFGVSSRATAWMLNPLQEACKFLPPATVAAQYYCFILFDQTYHQQRAFYSFVGDYQNNHGDTVSKPADYSQNGFPLGPLAIAGRSNAPLEYAQPFQDLYLSIVLLDGAMLFQGESQDLDFIVDKDVHNYVLANIAENCLYNAINEILIFADDKMYPNPGWQADTAKPQRYNVFPTRPEPVFETFAGQQAIEIYPFWFQARAHASATVAPGETRIPVDSLANIAVGQIIDDCGATAYEHCGIEGGTTGAIPHYFYVATTSCANRTGPCAGPGTITIACGKSDGCSAPAVTGPGIRNGDLLVFSLRLDWPTSVFNYQQNPPTAPMPAGTLVKPMTGGWTNVGYSNKGAFPPPSTPQVSSLVSEPGYVFCPDPADPHGSVAYINRPGTRCSDTAARITFAANTAQTWGFATPANLTCPDRGRNWGNSGFGAADRINETYAVAKLANAILGETPVTTIALAKLAPLLPDAVVYRTETLSTYWAFSRSFAPGP